ncbi:hypothetical protein T484DRAFT_1766583 [Baffinella frigidus]|nr:hypothetical protein T484DRAFT_1766583 [Cryptophyta sp. CCMP2293]
MVCRYVEYAEAAGAHQEGLEATSSWSVGVGVGGAQSAGLQSAASGSGSAPDVLGTGLRAALLPLVHAEAAAPDGSTPIARAVTGLTGAARVGNVSNVARALAAMEDAAFQPERQERHEWKMAASGASGGGNAAWGWYSAYPTNRFAGDVGFHLLIPLMDVVVGAVVPMCGRAQAAGALESMLGRAWPHYPALHDTMCAYERGRESLAASAGAIRVVRKVLGDEVLLLALSRADTRLREAPHPLPRHFAHAHVGCAGIQDSPELHLHLLRQLEHESGPTLHLLKLVDALAPLATPAGSGWFPEDAHSDGILLWLLEHESGPTLHLLKLVDALAPRPTDGILLRLLEHESGPLLHLLKLVDALAPLPTPAGGVATAAAPHAGLDAAAAEALWVLLRLLSIRSDPYARPPDRNVESAALHLTGALVSCLARPPPPVGLPAPPPKEGTEPAAALARGRSAVSIRQAWAAASGAAAEAQKRALLDLATSHDEPAEVRVAVLAFLSQAVASQPGLADWLFEADGDAGTEAGCASAGGGDSLTLDDKASPEDGYYTGWILEVRGGRGTGQRARVVTRYDGAARRVQLGEPWDVTEASGTPDETSHYLLARQLQLSRFIKTLLHPDVPYSGGGVGSQRELNRLKVTEHSLVLVETIFLAAPAERAGVIHAFSDPACLLWGAASPEEGEIVNATNRWRSYTLRLYTPPSAARRSVAVFAAPGGAFAELSSRADRGAGGAGAACKVALILSEKHTERTVAGAVRNKEGTKVPAGGGFWDVIKRCVRAEACVPGGGEEGPVMGWEEEESGAVIRTVKMPKALRRKPLAMFDGASKEGSALLRLLSALLLRDGEVFLPGVAVGAETGRVGGKASAVLKVFLKSKEAGLKRVRVELRIADATLQALEHAGNSPAESADAAALEHAGNSPAECADAAVGQMWERLSSPLLFFDMDGHSTKLRPVALPATFRAALFASACDPPPSTLDETEILEGLLLLPKAPEADATEALCRRLHIEALAVSIAAMHLQERSDGAPEEDATRSPVRNPTEALFQ